MADATISFSEQSNDGWRDCSKLLPYFDYKGSLRFPWHTQMRVVVKDGRRCIEYREREETPDEFLERQW